MWNDYRDTNLALLANVVLRHFCDAITMLSIHAKFHFNASDISRDIEPVSPFLDSLRMTSDV